MHWFFNVFHLALYITVCNCDMTKYPKSVQSCEAGDYMKNVTIRYVSYRKAEMGCETRDPCNIRTCVLSRSCGKSKEFKKEDENRVHIAGMKLGKLPDSTKYYCCLMPLHETVKCRKRRFEVRGRFSMSVDNFRDRKRFKAEQWVFRDIKMTLRRAARNGASARYAVEAEACQIDKAKESTEEAECYKDEEDANEDEGEETNKKEGEAEEDEDKWIEAVIAGPVAGGTAGGLSIGLLAACYQFDLAQIDHASSMTYSPNYQPVPIEGKATLVCNAGYKAVNSPVKCIGVLTWKATPSCERITCDKNLALSPNTGSITYTKSISSSKVAYKGTADIKCSGRGTELMVGQFTCEKAGWTESCSGTDCFGFKSDVSDAYYDVENNNIGAMRIADRRCTRRCAQLATIVGSAEYEFVVAKVEENGADLRDDYYIGFERLANSGTGPAAEAFLKWYDGTAFTYTQSFWFTPPFGNRPLNPNCNTCWNTCACTSCGSIRLKYFRLTGGPFGFNDIPCRDQNAGAICQMKVKNL